MPADDQTPSFVGMSTSVAVFLLLTSVCCMLSLSSSNSRHEDEPKHHHNSVRSDIRVPGYVPNVAMLCVMTIGIVAMVCKL